MLTQKEVQDTSGQKNILCCIPSTKKKVLLAVSTQYNCSTSDQINGIIIQKTINLIYGG